MINTNMQTTLFLASTSLLLCTCSNKNEKIVPEQPNVILIMADDLGYGDLACYGNTKAKTPHLDQMASDGVKLTRFYAAAPVSSPTRASCLTGRHPYRVNIPWAGDGFLPMEEITIAEALKSYGYATGHFGKWHVGTLSKTMKQSYFPGEVDPNHYSPPWKNGFDECFTTESMVPTYNPYYMVGPYFETEGYQYVQNIAVAKGQRTDGFVWRDRFWTGEGKMVDEWLEGDVSKIVMDKAMDFMERKTEDGKPFLSLIWFHTPHSPVVAGDDDRALYPTLDIQEQHWFGAITAMDRQVGRLREWLKENGLAENTIIWFCSDNGPSYQNTINSNGGLRDKKAALYEGGIRVPAIVEWPAKILQAEESGLLSYTSDLYPSILWACGVDLPQGQPQLDGTNVLQEIIKGDKKERNIYFQSPLPGRLSKNIKADQEQFAVIGDQYKLISIDNGDTYQLYDLKSDKKESKDIAAEHTTLVAQMKKELEEWRVSCKASSQGKDYE